MPIIPGAHCWLQEDKVKCLSLLFFKEEAENMFGLLLD